MAFELRTLRPRLCRVAMLGRGLRQTQGDEEPPFMSTVSARRVCVCVCVRARVCVCVCVRVRVCVCVCVYF